jgi:hypothetical protein
MKVEINWIYKHYKTGNLYKVLAVAKHSETLEEMVVYEALYNNETAKIWARPLKMFLEEVEWPKDSGIKVLRFELQK